MEDLWLRRVFTYLSASKFVLLTVKDPSVADPSESKNPLKNAEAHVSSCSITFLNDPRGPERYLKRSMLLLETYQ
jgi:hypothetical protein